MRFREVLQGNAAQTLAQVPHHHADLIVADPHYPLNYRDRRGRSLANDDNAGGVLPVFPELLRVLKLDSYCVQICGWSAIAQFSAVSEAAGFSTAGHIVLSHPRMALRLTVAQIIAGSELWAIEAKPQKALSEAIGDSLANNRAEASSAKQRAVIRQLLGIDGENVATIVPGKHNWQVSRDLHAIFAKLVTLEDADLTRILTFVGAETLAAGTEMVDALGVRMGTNMANHWTPDETFFDLLRDKEAVGTMLREIGGKQVADAKTTATAKVQQGIIRDYLSGTRKEARTAGNPAKWPFPWPLTPNAAASWPSRTGKP